MDTHSLSNYRHKRQHAQIRAAARTLAEGGVVAIPTDTVYALAASPFSEDAIERIFSIKNRQTNTPFPLLINDGKQLSRWTTKVSVSATKLIEAYWPGPLTLVLPKNQVIPDSVTAGKDTVALRVPDHIVPRELAQLLDGPITGTSANRSKETPLTNAPAVRKELGSKVDMIIDGGPSLWSMASTVLDVSTCIPRILREGTLSAEQIQLVVGNTKVELAL